MFVLDTHTWWWAISEPQNLSLRATETIAKAPDGQLGVAAISLWEFVMMVQRGKITLNLSPQAWFDHAFNVAGTVLLPLSEKIAIDSCYLPGSFHKDPADRMIVATTRIHHATLITKDEKIRAYPHVQTV